MKTMNELPTAKTRPASNWSAIWILPLIALAIGGWLAWKYYSEAGVEIQVYFDTGDGIQAGKTEVMYKGMPVGKVKSLALDDAGKRRGVITTIEMNKATEPHLRSNSRFWLVKPSVTLAGITGLETLVSGNYIAFNPGDGKSTREYVALDEAPPLADTAPGLHLTLKAERLGSLNRDSPIFYKQLQVGRVKSYALGEDQKTVEIKIYIEPAYASLVRKHTRFWNASGVTVDAGLSGVKVHTESLASIIAGGIAFATPEHREDSPPPDPSLPFRLYEDFDAAQAGIKIKVHFADFEGLQKDGRTPVMFKGIQAGVLKDFAINEDLSGATAELMLDPLTEDYLVEGTEFWVVKPSISLAGITGIDALVKGNYIAIRPGEKGAKPKREFVARSKAPPLDISAPGLHLVLLTDTLGSIDIDSPVLYKQVKVGSVQSYQLSRDRQRVVIGVHIEPDYVNLVNSSTRFWNASGVKLSGGLSGIEVKSESLQTMIAGGIAFETPDPNAAPLGKRIARFELSPDRDAALQSGVAISIEIEDGDGLRPGTPIRYKGLDVGKIDRMELSEDLHKVMLHARLTNAGDRIARNGSRFWVVKPELGLARTANLGTLVSGQYLEVQPGPKNATRQTAFVALADAPIASAKAGLQLVLSTPNRGSLKPGVPVTYRDVKVGSVTDFELGPSSDRVLVRVLIEPRYAPLVHTGTRFWNTSGIGVDAGLIKGIKIRTDSLESMLEGGIAFATPEQPQMGNPARPGQTFALHEEASEEWLKWAPKIVLDK
jgi:paraquat-inducible protein B